MIRPTRRERDTKLGSSPAAQPRWPLQLWSLRASAKAPTGCPMPCPCPAHAPHDTRSSRCHRGPALLWPRSAGHTSPGMGSAPASPPASCSHLPTQGPPVARSVPCDGTGGSGGPDSPPGPRGRFPGAEGRCTVLARLQDSSPAERTRPGRGESCPAGPAEPELSSLSSCRARARWRRPGRVSAAPPPRGL